MSCCKKLNIKVLNYNNKVACFSRKNGFCCKCYPYFIMNYPLIPACVFSNFGYLLVHNVIYNTVNLHQSPLYNVVSLIYFNNYKIGCRKLDFLLFNLYSLHGEFMSRIYCLCCILLHSGDADINSAS